MFYAGCQLLDAGTSLFRSAEPALEQLRFVAQNFPRGTYADDALYRLGRYYAPYRGYRYRRFDIGLYIGAAFFGSRYWLDDPWRYRLPAAYGPYRWIRYYDDVLLIDTRDGYVVDVIHDFFY